MSEAHDDQLAAAFDGQAVLFERSPIQSDPAALERLVAFANLPDNTLVLDAGCGPGLVAEAFLTAGCRVHGVDLSEQMVERARRRCARFGDRARFTLGSSLDLERVERFDAAVSRYVIHHVEDPLRFLSDQRDRLRPGGILIACDHTTDPEPARRAHHHQIECLRDRTHTRNLTLAELVDLFTRLGIVNLSCAEEPFTLDFDEWFDRGTSVAEKSEVRDLLLRSRESARGFAPRERADGTFAIDCWRAMIRGTFGTAAVS